MENIELSVAKMAFELRDIHNDNLEKEPFLNRVLEKYVDILDSGGAESTYSAPYTSIVQSSGTGKSRMLEILSRDEEFCVVYCNLNKSDANAYPSRTKGCGLLVGANIVGTRTRE